MRHRTVVAGLIPGLLLVGSCHSATPSSEAGPPGTRPSDAGPREELTAGAVASLPEAGSVGEGYTDMVDLLRGRFAGLQVSRTGSGEISLRIRGAQSFMGSGEPLLVVDGVSVPAHNVSHALLSMNPSDVRSIEVLKDAGSTAAYGIRGGNGVVVIRLKRH